MFEIVEMGWVLTLFDLDIHARSHGRGATRRDSQRCGRLWIYGWLWWYAAESQWCLASNVRDEMARAQQGSRTRLRIAARVRGLGCENSLLYSIR